MTSFTRLTHRLLLVLVTAIATGYVIMKLTHLASSWNSDPLGHSYILRRESIEGSVIEEKGFGGVGHQVPHEGLLALAEIEPRPDSLFFVETAGKSLLSLKALCSVESALLHHPNSSLYLMLTSNVIDWQPPASSLATYYNFHVRHINVESFISSSPLKPLWTLRRIQKSKYLISHLSDVLRFLILHRYGGTYLDMDQLVMRPLPDVPNFIGKESKLWIGKAKPSGTT